jgi:hypothetical protein
MKRVIIFLSLAVIVLTCISSYNYGFKDGLKFNLTSIATGLVNRSQSDNVPDELPLYKLKISEENLNLLNADLPTSGKTRVPGNLIFDGISYPVEVKYRGNLALHWKGPKKSMRIFFLKKSPFGNMKKINFVNPKTYHVINNHISMWVGKQMGMNTIHDKMAFLKLNGKNYGVMEIMEQPDGKYEENRNLRKSEVPVYKGDYIPEGDTVMVSEQLWKSELNWAYKSDANHIQSDIVLKKIVEVVNSNIPNSEKCSSIEKYIDIDEYIRYYAGLRLINTVHIDQTHNQIIVFNQEKEKFYPVLWDPTIMWPAHKDNNFYLIYDALCYVVMSNPKWREKRDQIIYEYTTKFHDENWLYEKMDKKISLIENDVYLDHNKCNPITSNLNDVNKFSNFHFLHSYEKLKDDCKIHFDEMKTAISFYEVQKDLSQNQFIMSFKSNAPIIVELEVKESGDLKVIDQNVFYEVLEKSENRIKVKVFGNVIHIDGAEANPYAVSRSYVPAEGQMSISSKTSIDKVVMYNAITGEEIK